MTTGVISELRVNIDGRMFGPLVITTDHRGGEITLEGRNEQKGAHTEGEEGSTQYPCREVGNDTSGEEVTRQGQKGMRGVDVWSPDHTFPCICDLTMIASTTDRCKRRVRRSKRRSNLASGDDPGRGMSGATWSSGQRTEVGQFLSSFGFLAPHCCGGPDTMRTVFQHPAHAAQLCPKGQRPSRPAASGQAGGDTRFLQSFVGGPRAAVACGHTGTAQVVQVCADEIEEIEALSTATARLSKEAGPWATPPGFAAVSSCGPGPFRARRRGREKWPCAAVDAGQLGQWTQRVCNYLQDAGVPCTFLVPPVPHVWSLFFGFVGGRTLGLWHQRMKKNPSGVRCQSGGAAHTEGSRGSSQESGALELGTRSRTPLVLCRPQPLTSAFEARD